MEYTAKASVSKKVKNSNMILICIIGSITLLGLVMAIYSLFKLKFLFALIYLIAVVLGFSYVVMRINSILATCIVSSKEHLFVRNWVNGFFPYHVDKGFIGEFIPEKNITKKIEIKAISKIYIGTKKYILKLVTDGEFFDLLAEYDKKYSNILKRMEFLYIETKDKKEVYMSVTDFDSQEIATLLKPIIDNNERIDFRSNNRIVCKNIPPKRIVI